MKLDNHPIFQKQDPAQRPQYLVELLRDFVKEHGLCRVLEVGCIRVDSKQYHDGDGHSTLYFAQLAKELGLAFVSVDLKTDVCRNVLLKHGLNAWVSLQECGGIPYMKTQYPNTFGFVYLDGPNDAGWTADAFKAALYATTRPGLIALDDCEEWDAVSYKEDAEKGRVLVPWLKQLGIPMYRTGKKIIVVRTEDCEACCQ